MSDMGSQQQALYTQTRADRQGGRHGCPQTPDTHTDTLTDCPYRGASLPSCAERWSAPRRSFAARRSRCAGLKSAPFGAASAVCRRAAVRDGETRAGGCEGGESARGWFARDARVRTRGTRSGGGRRTWPNGDWCRRRRARAGVPNAATPCATQLQVPGSGARRLNQTVTSERRAVRRPHRVSPGLAGSTAGTCGAGWGRTGRGGAGRGGAGQAPDAEHAGDDPDCRHFCAVCGTKLRGTRGAQLESCVRSGGRF